MMKFQASLCLLAALLCSACVSRSFAVYDESDSRAGRVLGTVKLGEQEVGRYVLRNSSDGVPSVNRTVQRTYQVARVGVDARSVDKALAKELGIEPWKGVLVDFVAEESAALRAGIQARDVLLELAGMRLTSREQFVEVVASELEPGVETTAVVWRGGAEGERVNLKLVPGVREVEEATTDRIHLGFEPGIDERTGMLLGTISADLAHEIWGTEGTRVYVSRVQLGSPAYLAGIRQGDQVVGCDGADVSNTTQVLAAIQGEPGPHQVSIMGTTGAFETRLDVANSLKKKSSFFIPIIIDYSSRMDRTQTSFLDFIFQFGFNYKSKYLRTESRRTARSSSLSILPLGMFEFERSPTKSKNTLFWFITWKTDR